MKTPTGPQPVLDSGAKSSDQTPSAAVDRRQFLRIIGAATAPLVVSGCLSDEDDEWDESTQLREVNPEVDFPIKVEKAKSGQSIIGRPEHLSLDEADFLPDLSVGDQCRVVRGNGRVALYTVGEHHAEAKTNRVRMSKAARKRLGTSDTFSATLKTAVLAQGMLTDDEARDQSEFVERLVDDEEQTYLVVLASHGGSIEPRTDNQAEYMREQFENLGMPVSSWICKGYKQGGGAFDQWHITSTDVSRNSFPGLDQIADRDFTYAVSFHGLSGDNVIVGGGASAELKEAIRAEIVAAFAALEPPPDIEVVIATGNEEHSGDSVRNVVNWLTKDGVGGIQISSSLAVRNNVSHRQAIVDAIVAVLLGEHEEGEGDSCPPPPEE